MDKINSVSSVAKLLLLVSLVMLGVFSCTDSTSPDRFGNLSGTVILENDTDNPENDPLDFSGITIALYNLAPLDTTIVRINRQYPNIGVHVSQETEFDHRLQNPVKVTQTQSDGTFIIENIPAGNYNLVALKQGWGFRYLYELTITEGENTLTSSNNSNSNPNSKSYILNSKFERSDNPRSLFTVNSSLSLSPIRVLPSTIQEPTTFLSERVYHFPENTTILADVTINEETTILISPGVRVVIHASLNSHQSNRFSRITSSDRIYTTTKTETVNDFSKLTVRNQSLNELSHLIISWSNDGLDIKTDKLVISNSILRSSKSVALLGSSEITIAENLLIQNNLNRGIYIYNNFEVYNSLFLNNREALLLYETTSLVRNNSFMDNYLGIRPLHGVNDILNNNFDRNDFALVPCGSNPFIKDNNFYDNGIDIEINRYRGGARSSPDIRYNNFYGDNMYISIWGRHSFYADGVYGYLGVNTHQVYPNNYLQEQDLTRHIYDANYQGLNRDITLTVTMRPRLVTPNPDAGIKVNVSRY